MSDPKKTPGMLLDDSKAQVNMQNLRSYRLGRIQAQLQQHDYAAAVLYDPINIRYASGSRNMAVWTSHSPARYLLVPAQGKCILFDYHNSEHLSAGLETIAEVRLARSWFFFVGGSRSAERAQQWADSLSDAIRSLNCHNQRIAFDRLDPYGLQALEQRGYSIHEGQEVCELARAIKSADELACMNYSLSVCDIGMARMRDALRPGLTENQLWAELHYANIQHGGEWIETRLLSSGGRTNPWFQESSDRLIRPGDLVCFDTDMIGPFGYCADVSRTYFCGPGKPSAEQKTLYSLAYEQIQHNLEQLHAGLSFQDYADRAWPIPDRYRDNRYGSIAHGVGLADEWPIIGHAGDDRANYPGELQPGMTLCIESYIGAKSGSEGVKLEQQVLITDSGYELLSTYPFEENLLGD